MHPYKSGGYKEQRAGIGQELSKFLPYTRSFIVAKNLMNGRLMDKPLKVAQGCSTELQVICATFKGFI